MCDVIIERVYWSCAKQFELGVNDSALILQLHQLAFHTLDLSTILGVLVASPKSERVRTAKFYHL